MNYQQEIVGRYFLLARPVGATPSRDMFVNWNRNWNWNFYICIN